MLIIGYENEREKYHDIFQQMYALRAQGFKSRRDWEVNVKNGIERDHFDNYNPLYFCVLNREGDLLASLRLLPTTGPTMINDVFPEVIGNKEPINHPLIWESSRFCVNTKLERNYKSTANPATYELLAGMFGFAKNAGIKNVVSVFDLAVERILRSSGCRFERLGKVQKLGGLKSVGGIFEVSQRVVDCLEGNISSHPIKESSDARKLILPSTRGSSRDCSRLGVE